MTAALTSTGSPLWYFSRATGVVTLVLLTASVVLGLLTSTRAASPRWPRFVVNGLHRNISLLVVVFLGIHVSTTVADSFTSIGLLDALLPFHGSYRPLWLGFGALAGDLVLALVITSLVRVRLGLRAWRAIHWLAYVSWPVAVLHGLGTGTDVRQSWMQVLTAACVAAVLGLLWLRLAVGWPRRAGVRLTAGVLSIAALPALFAWVQAGPLAPHWARRAGTPVASAAAAASAATSAAPVTGTGRLAGRLSQQQAGSSGQVRIDIGGNVDGTVSGRLDIALLGQASGGGVALESSQVTWTDSQGEQYAGTVTSLSGDQLQVALSGQHGRLSMALALQISETDGNGDGTVTGRVVLRSAASS